MTIFVEHWGDNLPFYLNFALFSTLGRMNLDHDFVQVWKFSEHKKKMQMEHFFAQIQVKTKKKVFIKNRTLFSPNTGDDKKKKGSSTRIEHFFPKIYAQMYTHSNYWGMPILKLLGGCSQIIGGINALMMSLNLVLQFCLLVPIEFPVIIIYLFK